MRLYRFASATSSKQQPIVIDLDHVVACEPWNDEIVVFVPGGRHYIRSIEFDEFVRIWSEEGTKNV